MTERVRLIATDLDGTLLRSDRTVSERTRATVARAQEAGITFVVATARHPLTAQAFAEQAGITGLAICVNGALIYDLGRNAIVAEEFFPAETAELVIHGMRSVIPDICFAVVRSMDFACEPGYAAITGTDDHGRALEDVPQADALELLDVPMTKLIIRHPVIHPKEIYSALSSLKIDGYEAALSGAPFVDIVRAGVSKAGALATICRNLGIDASEVVAFGDAPNDLQMLRWAGRAVAVANAYPEVLAEIGDRTLTNDEDGVAVAVESILLQHQ